MSKDLAFPDPGLIEKPANENFDEEGGWRAFGSTVGSCKVVKASSKEFKYWEGMPNDALPQVSSWVNSTKGIWAPHVFKNYNTEQYIMYCEFFMSILSVMVTLGFLPWALLASTGQFSVFFFILFFLSFSYCYL